MSDSQPTSDETETRRRVERLEKSERRSRAILESISDGFFTLDSDWRFDYVNPEAERILGRAPGTLLGKVLWQEYPGTVGNEFEAAYRRVVANREAESFLAWYPDHERWYDVRAFPSSTGLSIYFRDATESKRAEAALRASEERFRTLFDSMDEGFCVVEMIFDAAGRAVDYRIIEMNPAFERHTGLHGVIGRTVRDFAPDLEEFWFETYGRVATTGEPIRFVSEAKALEGRWFDVYAFRIGEPQGKKVAILFNDITARKRAEEQVRRTAADLSEAGRRKDEFLATLAHELRNPLAPIRNSLEIMRLSGNRAETVERARAVMERQLQQLVRLVDDLLDLGRISTGKLGLRKHRATLTEVVNSAVEAARPLIDANGLQLTVVLPPQPIDLDADLTRLAQVFVNLLNNAAKFTAPGGRVALEAECDGADVVIAVQDSGVGIAADQLPRIFEMFSQVGSSLDGSRGGLGIGLTLAQRLVELHQGRIDAASAGPGLGSRFTVRLPVMAAATPEASAVEATGEPSGTPLRILVVDDNEDAATSLAAMLELMGHVTRTVHDGVAATTAAAAFRPDVVLLDIGLPGLNGYEVARRIRAERWGRDMTLLALTGWGQEDDRRKSDDAGFDRHLVKPVDPAVLTRLLAELGRAGTRAGRTMVSGTVPTSSGKDAGR